MGIKRLRCSATDSGFFYKNCKRRGIKNLSRKVHETGLLDLPTGSGRPRTSRSCVAQPGAVADQWYSWPMASTLVSCVQLRSLFCSRFKTTHVINCIFHTSSVNGCNNILHFISCISIFEFTLKDRTLKCQQAEQDEWLREIIFSEHKNNNQKSSFTLKIQKSTVYQHILWTIKF